MNSRYDPKGQKASPLMRPGESAFPGADSTGFYMLSALRAWTLSRHPLKLVPVVAMLSACFLPQVPPSTRGDKGAGVFVAPPKGSWQDADKHDYYMSLEGDALTISYGGRVTEIGTVLETTPERIKACRFGRENIFLWRTERDLLIFQDVDLHETHRMLRLQKKPAALGLTNFHLPPPTPLSQGRISQIQRELYLRQQRDQESLRSSDHGSAPDSDALPWLRNRSDQESGPPSGQANLRFVETVTENTEFIRSLLAEVGWIDVERFGYSTSKSAFLLVQHSWEPSLMLAVLPKVKQDVDAGRMEPSEYALLYDRLQLCLGRRQRFGSQVANDETGALVVLPVEDPAKVDSLREKLGLIPLKEYVRVFGASEVKFSQACKNPSHRAAAAGRDAGRWRLNSPLGARKPRAWIERRWPDGNSGALD